MEIRKSEGRHGKKETHREKERHRGIERYTETLK
jgi:hypothetical protein